jgi:glutaredoxin-like protein
MSLFTNENKQQLQTLFNGMDKEVHIALFTQDDQCITCKDTKLFMEEISGLGSKIKFLHYDLDKDADRAKELNVDLAPAIVLLDADGVDYGVKFNGIPAGHEVNSFIAGLLQMSGIGEVMPVDLKTRIDDIKTPMHIRVFVTLGCPHCPGAVSKAHRLAMENDHITAEMIESSTFPELANEFDVSSVPKIIFNDVHDFVGNQPLESFVEMIEHVTSHA